MSLTSRGPSSLASHAGTPRSRRKSPPMTHEQLKSCIEEAAWFSNLGKHSAARGQTAIQSLEAWADDQEGHCDAHHRKVAESMEWLPAQAQDPDPIHGLDLPDNEQALAFYKQALASLRSVPSNPHLKVGAHAFQHVAHGAAAYACRRAALEISHGQPGFWCEVVPLYTAGHWPCGILPDRTLVVY